MKKRNDFVFVTASIVATVCVLLLINYVAITYCIGKLGLFTAMVVVVPTLCIAAVSFIIGYRIKWNWKRGVCIALVFTLLSWGVSQLTVFMAGNSLDRVGTVEPQGDSQKSQDDELMDELYDELDKKAYEYMLEQGLISEGDEIYGGGEPIGGSDSDNEITSSETYVGIQKSDPVTELIGNIVTFLAAYGLCFAGYKIRSKKLANRQRKTEN